MGRILNGALMGRRSNLPRVQHARVDGPRDDAGVIAGRYQLLRRLDQGGMAEVYCAQDLLVGEEVALKLLPALEDAHLLRLRSEVSALRMLQLPGVAHLLDEGMHGDRPFLAMERARGLPFPGCAGTVPWASLRDTVVALLEILARVHLKGVVHRDLKPDNVLVDESGRPTVLDFGLSAGSALGSASNDERSAVGTPAYVSPEQICGERADARSDLYSLGVMLYEALAGRGPQPGTVADQIMQRRLHEPAPPLGELAAGLPAAVASLIDRLLAREPEHRPRSAVDVLRELRGEGAGRGVHRLPWLGSREPILRLVHAARAGHSADLVGSAGSGRQRCLREVDECLQREDRRVAWLIPTDEPFGSVASLGEWSDGDEPETVEEAMRACEALLRQRLSEGVVLIADEQQGLDRWSLEVLERCRAAGSVLVARSLHHPERSPARETVELRPLTEEDLRPLFAGPDRLFHLRADGARELWLRTRGQPARVSEEVAAWERADLASWAGNELGVSRQALDRLRAGLQVLPPVPGTDALCVPLGEGLEEFLAWIALAAPNATAELLAKARGRRPWMVEAELAQLVDAGAVQIEPCGRINVLVSPHRLAQWTDEQHQEAHRALARELERGSEGRLLHLVAAGELEGVADEACELARRLVREGRLGDAEVALADTVHAVRQRGDPAAELRLFREWVLVALADFTPLALDRVLYELSRTRVRSPEVLHLEQFVHAAVAALETDGERALAEVRAVPPFSEPDLELERWRHSISVLAARTCPLDVEEAVLAATADWAERNPSPQIRASLAEWMGRLRYRQDRFDEAAELQAVAARSSERVSFRLSAMLNGASALMEACRLDEATELAASARDLAAACRHTLFEARAEWLRRAAEYRRGEGAGPDLELVDAASRVGIRDQEALICLTEAAVAWRAGRSELACELADRACQSWTAAAKVWGGLLARALALGCGAEPEAGEVEELVSRAEHCPQPEIAGQILSLLHRAGARRRHGWLALAAEIQHVFPRHVWSTRREVLSVDEMIEALTGAAPG